MRFNLYEYKIDAVYKDEEETSFIMFEKSIFKIVDYLISNKDITKINKINITERLKFPSIENLIELIPKQTPTSVSTLGSIYLVLLTDTILNFFLFI